MKLDPSILDDTEKLNLALRSLYLRHGFTRFRMGKFEKYDLYMQNKDFLISDNIITFTDTNGVLMALKPDVTLSIIKSRRDVPGTLQKICYNENVYRVSKGAGCFRELMQAGVECIGSVDERCVGETLLLAAESLALCAPEYVLSVSHLDILRSFVESVSDSASVRRRILKCVSEKNLHGISGICRDEGIAWSKAEALRALLGLYGTPESVMPRLRELCAGRALDAELAHLDSVLSVPLGAGLGGRVRLDFSSVSNMNYYNGVLFKGFIEGVPDSVLSGGQYDKLMRRMGSRSNAVGFAVYLDMLERLSDMEAVVPAFAEE
ncbi:MAG: hypothetical protein E7474_03110 [Ruminococcaceae bacterium]|nr:hypothetical protein [Oscillospiraceae bacterium]